MRIEEDRIKHNMLFGMNAKNVEEQIKSLIDLIFKDNQNEIDYDFFDIHGTVLLHGIPGTGKTTIISNCMHYALKIYGVDCYELHPSEIIESALGKANKNLVNAINEFEQKEKGILFIDELDRLCVNRQSDELDELKRMLIELMQFFDRQRISDKKIILCCTNVFSQIDAALIRRFSICEEMKSPTEYELIEYANICREKAAIKGKIIGISDCIDTFDSVKGAFRKVILTKHHIRNFFELEED